MPKGQAAISWTPENDAKLLLSIVSCAGISVDYNKVAETFGPDVPGSCIQTRIRNLRKKAAGIGMTVDESPAKSTKRSAATENTDSNKKQKTADFGEDNTEVVPATPTKVPKTSTKTATKARVSPRKVVKKDYVKLDDPFVKDDQDSEEKAFNFMSEDGVESDSTGFTPINKQFETNIKNEI